MLPAVGQVPWILSRKAGGIALRFPEDRMSLGALTNPSIEVRREAETGRKSWCGVCMRTIPIRFTNREGNTSSRDKID